MKLLLNRLVADGLVEPVRKLSAPLGGGTARREAGIPADSEERFLTCMFKIGVRLRDTGEGGTSESCGRIEGEPEREPCLNGDDWKDIDGRLVVSKFLRDGRRTGPLIGRVCGWASRLAGIDSGGEVVSEPGAFTAFNADIGLVPMGPAP